MSQIIGRRMGLSLFHCCSGSATDAAWAAVEATWAAAILNALVIASAFGVIVFQRRLEERKRERDRQYKNLSVLMQASLLADYFDIMGDYINAAMTNNKLVSKWPINFYIDEREKTLGQLAATGDIGAGPLSLANHAISVAKSILDRVNSVCTGDNFLVGQLEEIQDFRRHVDNDVEQIWLWIGTNYANVVSTPEGAWARRQFEIRHSNLGAAQDMIRRLGEARARRPA